MGSEHPIFDYRAVLIERINLQREYIAHLREQGVPDSDDRLSRELAFYQGLYQAFHLTDRFVPEED